MTAAYAFIASCLIGAFIIEIRATALNLPRYAECTKCNAGHVNHDNQKQEGIHRASPF